MSKSDSSEFRGLHPRLKERLVAHKSQLGLFGGADETTETETADESKIVATEGTAPAPSTKAVKPKSSKVTKSTKVAKTAAPLLDDTETEEEPKTAATREIYTVTELCTEIKDTLRRGLGTVTVQGEIADFKGVHRNGHLYCSLKDASSQVRVVMWRNALLATPFEPKGGLEVIVTGKLDFYGGSGSLQINVERMEPVGIGALQLKFEQLKEKLQKEGLFDQARKRKVGALNWRIGLATGKSTAALQDMLRVFAVRFPLVEIFLFHTSVQGEKAPAEIKAAIERANRWSAGAAKPLDVLIVGRGGGSYEDLFSFNDEGVARAIAASKIPIVSAIGHEIDHTIADFVADRRAATPSNAAELSSPDRQDWIRRLLEVAERLPVRILDRIRDRQEKVDTLTNRLVMAAPHKKLQLQKELLKHREDILVRTLNRKLDALKSRLTQRAAVLDAMSPLKVLDRGYSVTKDSQGKALKSVAQIKVGELISLEVQDGQVQAEVRSLSPHKPAKN